jgi:phage terminase large subunit GpA-like protein
VTRVANKHSPKTAPEHERRTKTCWTTANDDGMSMARCAVDTGSQELITNALPRTPRPRSSK